MTPKQERFVEEYLIDLNATQAAIRAGYSKATANQQGPLLLVNVGVSTAITEAKAQRSERTGIDADFVLKRLAAREAATIGDFIVIGDDGLPSYNFDSATPDQIALISALQIDMVESPGDHSRTRKIKVTLPDGMKALELMGRHVNVQAFSDKLEIVNDPLAQLLKAIDGRTRGIPAPALRLIDDTDES